MAPLAQLDLPPLCLDMRERSHERLRLAVVVALLSPAANRSEELSMLLRLDALGKCLDAEFLGHVDDRADDVARLLREAAQKAHVELDEVDRIVLEDVQRRVAAAEIVEPDLIALVPVDGVVILGERALRDLDMQGITRNLVRGARLFYKVKDIDHIEIVA